MSVRSHDPIVLIVDDNDDTAEMYAEALRQSGFEPRGAPTGFEGLIAACNVQPEAIIVDLVIEGRMNGLTLLQVLRKNERIQDTPIIVVTGRVSERDQRDAERAGCDAFLPKPCLPEQLVSEVARLIARRSPRPH